MLERMKSSRCNNTGFWAGEKDTASWQGRVSSLSFIGLIFYIQHIFTWKRVRAFGQQVGPTKLKIRGVRTEVYSRANTEMGGQ